MVNFETIHYLGLKIHQGQKKPGVACGPSVFRDQGGVSFLEDVAKSRLVDFGDLDLSGVSALEAYSKAFKEVSRILETKDCLPIFFGGDHSQSIATGAALFDWNPSLGLIWLDAHADINDLTSSPSQNIHGMSVATLTGRIGNQHFPSLNFLKPRIKMDQIVYIGARDIDPGELSYIQDNNIKVFTTDEVIEKGASTIFQEAITYLCKNGYEDIYLSFDVDALDPEIFPHTGVPVTEGLTSNHVIEGLKRLSPYLKAIEIVEFNPKLSEKSDQSVVLLKRFVEALLT